MRLAYNSVLLEKGFPMKSLKFVSVFACSLYLCFVASCASDGASCTATTQGDGIVLLTCENGTTAVVKSGIDGRDGVQGSAGPAGPTGSAGSPGSPGSAGETGLQGESGLFSLLKMDDEPAGNNCPQGGVRISAGVDDDADGVLDADEVDEEKFVCNGDGRPMTGVLEGSIKLSNTLDVLRYSGFDTVTDVVFVDSGLALVELPALVDVGALMVNSASCGFGTTQRVRLAGLQRVYRDVYAAHAWQLEDLELPALQVIHGDLRVWDNHSFRTLDLGSLTHVHGDVYIRNCNCITNETVVALFDGVTVDGLVTIDGNGQGVGGNECL